MLYKNAHKNIEFVEKLGANPSSAFVDKRQMKRAFMNIIDNAVFSITLKSIEKVGGIAAGAGFNYKAEIRITTETARDETAKGDIIRMIFSDNGTGINDEVMQNMYEPYFSTKQGGTGLGLAITKNIMMENNAAISAKNNEKGGADFIIELPADKI